jgi:uncharacterized membrane protein YgdD (TMEM256/DUF423 family)
VNALVAAAVLGATGVVAGAFGAHALKGRLTAEQLVSFETGVRYQLIHALALMGVAVLIRQGLELRLVTHAFVWGTVLFSGSIYGLVLGGPRLLGPVTPLGGTLLIVGWIALAFAARGPGSVES